jgi:hypothetical protein
MTAATPEEHLGHHHVDHLRAGAQSFVPTDILIRPDDNGTGRAIGSFLWAAGCCVCCIGAATEPRDESHGGRPVADGVGPRNNHAERMLRHAVLWREGSLGSSSEVGCRFVERMPAAVQTLRLQDRPVLNYLSQAVVAHRAGLPARKVLTAD